VTSLRLKIQYDPALKVPDTETILADGYNLATLGRMLDDILYSERRFTMKAEDGRVLVFDPTTMKTVQLMQRHAS
jgi:hypothetical protein